MEKIKKNFVELKNNNEWQNLQNNTSYSNVVIFKFSPFCSISFRAEKYFKHWFDELDDSVSVFAAKVDVVSSKNLSGQIAEDLHIHHESPQIIWLDSEKNVKWSASHFEINEESLNSQLN